MPLGDRGPTPCLAARFLSCHLATSPLRGIHPQSHAHESHAHENNGTCASSARVGRKYTGKRKSTLYLFPPAHENNSTCASHAGISKGLLGDQPLDEPLALVAAEETHAKLKKHAPTAVRRPDVCWGQGAFFLSISALSFVSWSRNLFSLNGSCTNAPLYQCTTQDPSLAQPITPHLFSLGDSPAEPAHENNGPCPSSTGIAKNLLGDHPLDKL